MPEPTRCQNCGSLTADPRQCEICGAERVPPRSAWLRVGDTLEIALGATGEEHEADTGEFDLDSTAIDDTMPGFDDVTSTQRLHTFDDEPSVSGELLELAILTELESYHGHRTTLAKSPQGDRYRLKETETAQVEELRMPSGRSRESIDEVIGRGRHGGHALSLYRFVEGPLLAELAAPLPIDRIVALMRPIVELVGSLHEEGFLCLRLCPYTIKVGQELVFLEGVEGLYPIGEHIGLIPAIRGYTAPEVYAGVADTLTPASDLYALAMTVYQLFSGHDPPSDRITGYVPAMWPRDYDPSLAVGLEPFFDTAAHRDPAQRPQSAEEFMRQLEAAAARIHARRATPSPSLAARAAAETHVGIGKRLRNPVNQDAVFAHTLNHFNATLLAVADGVSTSAFGSGDIAANTVIRHVQAAWRGLGERTTPLTHDDAEVWLKQVIDGANDEIVAWVNERHTPFRGEPFEVMGTTVVLAYIYEGVATIVWAGDSSAWLVRSDYSVRLTREHNLRTLGLVDGVPVDVNLSLPQAAALARCVGSFEVTHDDRLSPTSVRCDATRISLQEGDLLLLSSDGLMDYAGQDARDAQTIVEAILLQEPSVELAALELILAANRGGGGDNIGVAIARIVQGTALFPVVPGPDSDRIARPTLDPPPPSVGSD